MSCVVFATSPTLRCLSSLTETFPEMHVLMRTKRPLCKSTTFQLSWRHDIWLYLYLERPKNQLLFCRLIMASHLVSKPNFLASSIILDSLSIEASGTGKVSTCPRKISDLLFSRSPWTPCTTTDRYGQEHVGPIYLRTGGTTETWPIKISSWRHKLDWPTHYSETYLSSNFARANLIENGYRHRYLSISCALNFQHILSVDMVQTTWVQTLARRRNALIPR